MGIGHSILSRKCVVNIYESEDDMSVPYYYRSVSLVESFSFIWVKLLALIIEVIIAFIISYIVFMRMDIR